ncbi:MAG TPA: site-2 protease family protein [Flexilinea sp.]|nr:site-2 protease family protein [Flexilinea sp.]
MAVPAVFVCRILTLIIAFTIHEFAHGFLADRFGDPTPRLQGRLTLNPLKHLDIFGSLMLLLTGFGWAKPVQIDTEAIRRNNKAGVMLVSFIGPFSNFLLALIGALLLKIPGIITIRWWGIPFFLSQFVWINLSLLIFNLVPLAPLDGEKVVEYFIPDSMLPAWKNVQQYGMQILLICFLILPYLNIDVFGKILSPLISGLYYWLVGG